MGYMYVVVLYNNGEEPRVKIWSNPDCANRYFERYEKEYDNATLTKCNVYNIFTEKGECR